MLYLTHSDKALPKLAKQTLVTQSEAHRKIVCAEQGVAPEAVAEAYHAYEQGSQVSPLSAAAVSNQSIQESQRLLLMVRAYQASLRYPQHAIQHHTEHA